MFYEQFRALCKVRNEAPSYVLERIGLTRMNASLWKKGGMPSAENIQKLANYFGVPVDYLLNTNAAMLANSSNMHRIISDAEIAKNQILLENLVKELDEIPKQNKRNAISEITAFVQFTIHDSKIQVERAKHAHVLRKISHIV